jgi:hypothetical protein
VPLLAMAWLTAAAIASIRYPSCAGGAADTESTRLRYSGLSWSTWASAAGFRCILRFAKGDRYQAIFQTLMLIKHQESVYDAFGLLDVRPFKPLAACLIGTYRRLQGYDLWSCILSMESFRMG